MNVGLALVLVGMDPGLVLTRSGSCLFWVFSGGIGLVSLGTDFGPVSDSVGFSFGF